MKKETKIAVVLLALLVTLGLLIGGQKLYNANLIEKPVIKQLTALDYIKNAAISKTDGVYKINVTFSKPGNLKEEYNQIDKIIAEKFKTREYEIVIVDTRDQFLRDELEKMELSIYQAVVRDDYVELEQRMGAAAVNDGFEYRLQIDRQNLYVQLRRDGKFLNEIIERNDTSGLQGNEKR
ncbi:MAG TPA: hypothetical protein VN441_07690 [Syntrophomonas sp.]|nr:hypothetical protein [Syntrophomonas sp.]